MRAMVVKQGLVVTDAGTGELNAAYGGLGKITGSIMPFVWANLYKLCSSSRIALHSSHLVVAASTPPSPPPPRLRSTVIPGKTAVGVGFWPGRYDASRALAAAASERN